MSKYFSEGIDLSSRQLRAYNTGLILGNRGCPYRCNFCHLFFGAKIRARPVPAVVEEIELQRLEHDIRHFFFLDYTFTLNEQWTIELCRAVRERGLDIEWTCQTRCDRLSNRVLREMQEAGCTAVWLGVESPQLRARGQLGKTMPDDVIESAIRNVRRYEMEPLVFLMIGFDGEDVRDLQALNRWIDEMNVYYALSTLTPRVGAPLFEAIGARQDLETRGWDYLRRFDGRLGMSDIARDRVGWFFEHHARHPRRVANAVRKSIEAQPRFS